MLKRRPLVGKFYKRMIKKSREIACFLSKRLQKIEGSSSSTVEAAAARTEALTELQLVTLLDHFQCSYYCLDDECLFSIQQRRSIATRKKARKVTDQLMKVTFSARLSRLTAVSFPHKSFYFSGGIATLARPLNSDLLQNPEIALLSWKITLNRTWNEGKGKSFIPRKLEIDFLPILSTADFLF